MVIAALGALRSQQSAQTLINEGIDAVNAEREQQAEMLLTAGLNTARTQNNHYEQARAILWLSEVAFMQRDYKETRRLCGIAKDIADQHLRTDTVRYYFTILQNLGVSNSYLGRLDRQRHFYREALKFQQQYFPADQRMRADALSNLSAAYYRTFMLDSALFWFDSTLTLATEDRFPDLRAIILLNKGKTHAYLRDYDQAIRHQQEALRLCKSSNERILGHSHLSDYFLEAGYPQQALRHLDSARVLVQEGQKSEQQYYSMVELKACQLYLQQKDTVRFRQTLLQLLRFIPKDDDNFVADRAQAMLLLANDQIGQQHYALAQRTALRALAVVRDQEHPEVIVQGYQLIARALARQNRFEESLRWTQQGLVGSTPGFEQLDIDQNPGLAQIQNLEYSLPLLESKISYYRQWYEQDGKKAHLLAAVEAQVLSDSLLAESRRGMRSQQSRRILSDQIDQLQRESMLLYYRLYAIDQEEQWLEAAFRCAERGRALLQAEDLVSQEALRSIIPAALQNEEQYLSERMQYLRLKLAQQQTEDSLYFAEWQRELFSMTQQWEVFLSTLERDFPRYHELKYQLPFADITEVRNSVIADNEMLLSFTDLDHQVLCLGIGENETFFHLMPLPVSLQAIVPQLRKYLADRSIQYYPLANQLYEHLLAPTRRYWQGKHLVFIPDGQLWYVPFNALPTNATSQRAEQITFLVQETDLRWLYAAHRSMPGGSSTTNYRTQWLGMAPFGEALHSTKQTDAVLPALPGSLREIHRTESILSQWQSQKLVNSAASKSAFLAHARHAQIVHVSTHALSNEEEPLLSALFLRHDEHPLLWSDPLYAAEIVTASIPAELVVLSACETQLGRLEGGEGIAGWAQSFSLAGGKGLLASAWSVNDDTGFELMENFYQLINSKVGKASAYSGAQRRYLAKNDPLTLHPYFWAGFLYLGDNEVIEPADTNRNIPQASFLFIIILLAFLLFLARVWPRSSKQF